ncbi:MULTISPECIES: hypothetical protein [Arthrobacter]|uniref:Uncharacterized protein n=1 Tax=Arthrobacter terricola TaxID=2547396 RepID=A0A4R5K8C4_9MICC|nr:MULTISPECIES: hypothetical protein [Arthrobacter]MBT8163486.1 hypothetical protein [Arthrobacter sp. GN70]TDF89468.1 hypothetical protein E1809_22945 [Arthrobacter terricola]
MTVDGLLPETWPEETVGALDTWRQGHLIRGDLVAWLATAGGLDPVTGDDYSDDGDGLLAATAEIGDTDYFAIVSQTCDIAATGPGRRHPFVHVCPVRSLTAAFDSQKIQQARNGELGEYVYLTKPPITGAQWAVDLRVMVPLSKGSLARSSPIEGFACEDDEIDLAARIAGKFERPALHDYLSKDLVDSLNTLVTKARKASADWCEDVEQFRLEIEGPRLAPKRVRLVVITDVNYGSTLHLLRKGPVREYWKTLKKPLRSAGIEQGSVAFRYIDDLKAKDYRNSVPLNVPALGRGRFD